MKKTLLLAVAFVQLGLAVSNATASQLSCLIEPSQEIQLSSQVSGVVSEILVERGDTIKKGQVLVVLHREQAEVAVKTAKSKAAFALRKIDRNKELLEKNLISEFERDELVTELDIAKLDVEDSELKLKARVIRSPINGIVVKRNVSIGEHVGSEPVMELVSIDPLYAEVLMKADAYGSIEPGMSLTVKILGADVPSLAGKVTVVDKVIDAASGTFGYRIELQNKDLSIPAGLKCEVTTNELSGTK